MGADGGRGPLRKKGDLKRAAGTIRRAHEAIEDECRVYANTSTRLVPYGKRHVDLMEYVAGKAETSLQAHRVELTASEPMDLDTSWDFRTRKDRSHWTDSQNNQKPILIMLRYPCTLYCVNNRNANYRAGRRSC